MGDKVVLTEEEQIMIALVYVGEMKKYNTKTFDRIVGSERYEVLQDKAITLMKNMGGVREQDRWAFVIADKLLGTLNI